MILIVVIGFLLGDELRGKTLGLLTRFGDIPSSSTATFPPKLAVPPKGQFRARSSKLAETQRELATGISKINTSVRSSNIPNF